MMCVPVSDASFWGQKVVVEALERTLRFATDDAWTFEFTPSSGPDQPRLPLLDTAEAGTQLTHQPDHVLMLSGGADSLCAAVQSIGASRRPYLVSHRPSPAHDSRQRMIGNALGTRFGVWPLSRTSFPIHLVHLGASELLV